MSRREFLVAYRRPLQTILLVGGAALFLMFLGRAIRMPYHSTTQHAFTGHLKEIHGPIEVGQTFESLRADLSAVSIQIATYSDRHATGDVVFELRERPGAEHALRTAHVSAQHFRDHALHTFRFAPISDSLGQTYYVSLRSLNSRPGDAVTVDINDENPYRKHGSSSLYVFRDGMRTPEAVRAAQVPNADLVFSVTHRISLREYVWLTAADVLRFARQETRRLAVFSLIGGAAIILAIIAIGTPAWLRPFARRWTFIAALVGLLIGGLFVRLIYAERLPVTNDEGSMLLDAWVFASGRLPGGDGILKTPTIVQGLAGILRFITEPTLLGSRVLSIGAALMTVIPLLIIGRSAGGMRMQQLRIAGLWILAAAPSIFSVYLHAQPFQLLLLAGGLALFAYSMQGRAAREGQRSRWQWLVPVFSGVLLALAFGARKTSATAALPALGFLLLSTLPWRLRLRTLTWTLVGFFLMFGAITAEIHQWYGWPGVQYFLGVSVAGIDPDTTASAEERRSALINGILPIFREGLPILFLALIGVGASLERLLTATAWGRRFARVAWGIPLLAIWFGGRFLQEHERPEHFAFGLWSLWVAMGVVLLILAVAEREDELDTASTFPTTRRMLLTAFGIPLLWLFGTAVLYGSWIKFTANYLSEFLPPLVLLAALGGAWIAMEYRRRIPILLLLGALLAGMAYASGRSGYVFPHTGTFDRHSLEEAAAILRRDVPKDEPILTAAVAIPILSGHRVLLDVAHPTHYAYGYIEPEVRNIYMASAEAMVAAVQREVSWVILERLTAFSYLREYTEIERLLEKEFEPVASVENLSNPITILRRRSKE